MIFTNLEAKYSNFLKENNLPEKECMELLHEAVLTPEQRVWLSNFWLSWESAEEREREFVATRRIEEYWNGVRAYVYTDGDYGIEITDDGNLYLQIENCEWLKPNTPENLSMLERELFDWANDSENGE